jgi:hypothetical protein
MIQSLILCLRANRGTVTGVPTHSLHWESQSNTAQQSETGQNLIHHADRGYTILIFARDKKKTNGSASFFVYLGPADRITFESGRPIKVVWKLRYPIPVEMYEKNRCGG